MLVCFCISLLICFFFFLLSDHNYQADYFVAMVRAGYVCVAIIHWPLTWTAGSLTCAQMLMRAIAHGGVRTPEESLHWKLTLGRKSFTAPSFWFYMYLELYLFILLLLFIWRGSHAFDFRLILGERGGSCDCFVPLYASSSSSFFIRLFVMYQVTRRLPKAHSLELQFQPQSQARHGHDQCYRQYSSRTEHRRTIFVPRGVRDWSSLPQETDQDPTHDTFIVKPPHLNKPSPAPPPPH